MRKFIWITVATIVVVIPLIFLVWNGIGAMVSKRYYKMTIDLVADGETIRLGGEVECRQRTSGWNTGFPRLTGWRSRQLLAHVSSPAM